MLTAEGNWGFGHSSITDPVDAKSEILNTDPTLDYFNISNSSGANGNIFKVDINGCTIFRKLTEAQRLAIATPELGSLVYQTDGTEGVYVYKSTGWVFAY